MLRVRVLTHREDQASQLLVEGAEQAISGDIRDEGILKQALTGIHRVYHICPNVSPDEYEIGKKIVTAARKAGVNHLVYHSVLHPQVEAMPHHWQKMRVEEALFTSGLDFTILQPCAYMQNILAGWKSIVDLGIYSVPYSLKARISIVDLEDVGTVAAEVLTSDEYRNGIFELSGPQALTQVEVAQIIGEVLGKPIRAVQQDLSDWVTEARNSRMDEYQIKTLVKMFEYYDKYGLVGCSRVMHSILQKPPRTLAGFVAWYNQGS